MTSDPMDVWRSRPTMFGLFVSHPRVSTALRRLADELDREDPFTSLVVDLNFELDEDGVPTVGALLDTWEKK